MFWSPEDYKAKVSKGARLTIELVVAVAVIYGVFTLATKALWLLAQQAAKL